MARGRAPALAPAVKKKRSAEQQYRYRMRDRLIAEWLFNHNPKLYAQAETEAWVKIAAERGELLPGDPPTRKAS